MYIYCKRYARTQLKKSFTFTYEEDVALLISLQKHIVEVNALYFTSRLHAFLLILSTL